MSGIITALVGSFAPAAPAFESIATVTLSSGNSNTVTFNSIPSTYKHLQIRAISRSTRTGSGWDYLLVQANSDTGSNYTRHFIYGTGAGGTTSTNYTSQTSMMLGANAQVTATTNSFSASIIDILDYQNTKYKTFKSFAGQDMNNTNGVAGLWSGLWMNTSAITSITLRNNISGDLAQNSTFALYGIKG